MKRVLIIDKHRLFRQVLGIVLTQNTDLKESVEFGSLAEACRTLGNSNRIPDLAVVNLDLTTGDELELIRELRTRAPCVPVLAIALMRDARQRDRALRAGANEVLTMDTSPKEIADVAKRLISE